jgi:ankyrin repeat protein
LLLLLLRTTVKYEYCLTRSLLSRAASTRGRGIASHLHAVHTPWKAPSNAERKRRRLKEEKQNRTIPSTATTTAATSSPKPILQEPLAVETNPHQPKSASEQGPWEPSPKEVDDWNAQVLLTVAQLDKNPLLLPTVADNQQEPKKDPAIVSMMKPLSTSAVGLDRLGNRAKSYKASLPPFLQAASDGNLVQLQLILESCSDNPLQLWQELNRTDRHGSIAEHWAAGGGHLECLMLLKDTRQQVVETLARHEMQQQQQKQQQQPRSRIRRRDGKTALHYAARNGHVHCLKFLLQQGHAVDETSGDGTTSFHLACFGAHLDAMKCLLDHGADPLKAND